MGCPRFDPWPLTGRDAEVTRIEDDAERGVVLVGEAGVGKTRLLDEMSARAEQAARRVVRVVGTRSLTAVPFGAFAGVLRRGLESGAPFDVLQRALRAFAGDGELAEVVLAVDDAHLLDDASAGLVVLAAQSGARILATARSREPGPEAVTRLWKDEYAQRIELEPLDEAQVGALLHAALGSPVDGRARCQLFEVTRGNMLFLRELVRHALVHETLVERGGVWSWTAPETDVPGVRDLVLARIDQISPAVRDLIDLLAVGEPLGAELVRAAYRDEVLHEAETERIITWETTGARREIRLVHPLYTEVVRESLGGAQRAAVATRVAGLLSQTGARRHGDRLRIAVLRLDGGTRCDPDELIIATREAFVHADTVLGERLARAAIAAGGSPEADILLGNVFYWSGRHDEVIDLLDADIVDSAPPEIAVHAALLVASSLFWGLGRFEEADAWLDRGVAAAGLPYALDLVGQRAQMLMFAGRAPESIDVGRTVLDHPEASVVARLRAYSGLLPSAASCGRQAEVEREIPTAMGLVSQTGSDMAFAAGGVMVGSFVTRLFTGGLDQLDVMLRALHGDALRRIDDPFRGVWAFLLGRGALAQGRLAEATTLLRDAASLLHGRDPGAMLPWAIAALAQTLGATGDAGGATQAMRELDTVRLPTMHNIDVDIELGRAWAASARGERSHAQEIAEKIGRSLLDDGRLALGAMALHNAVRLGADPSTLAADLDAVARTCDGIVVEAFAAHAHALIDADADALLSTADLFETAGWLLQAAECAAGASQFAAAAGLRARQRDAATRSAALASGCGPALTPMLETIAGRSALGTLTRREQEIALMAARGLSKREMADTLFLSQRTIGNHINHVYGKLGISSREELRAAIGV